MQAFFEQHLWIVPFFSAACLMHPFIIWRRLIRLSVDSKKQQVIALILGEILVLGLYYFMVQSMETKEGSVLWGPIAWIFPWQRFYFFGIALLLQFGAWVLADIMLIFFGGKPRAEYIPPDEFDDEAEEPSQA